MAQVVTLPLRTVGVVFLSGIAGSALYSNTQIVTGIFGELLRVTADRISSGIPSSRSGGAVVPADGGAHASAINAIAEQVRALTAEVQRGTGSTSHMPSFTLYSAPTGRVPWVFVVLGTATGMYMMRSTVFKLLKVLLYLGKDTLWVSPDKLGELRQTMQSQMHKLDVAFRDFSGSVSDSIKGVSERLDSSIEYLSVRMAEDNDVTRKEVGRVGSEVEVVQDAIEDISAQMDALNEATAFSKQGITLLCTIVSNSINRDAPSYNELQDFVTHSTKHALEAGLPEATKLRGKTSGGHVPEFQAKRFGCGIATNASGLEGFRQWEEGHDTKLSNSYRFAGQSGGLGSVLSRSGDNS